MVTDRKEVKRIKVGAYPQRLYTAKIVNVCNGTGALTGAAK